MTSLGTVADFFPHRCPRWGRRRATDTSLTKPPGTLCWLLVASALVGLTATFGWTGIAGAAPTLTTLFSFVNLKGTDPFGSLLLDSAGNLYGGTFTGGANDDGVAFELSPPAKGQTSWAETVLQAFLLNGAQGDLPHATLIRDSAGNLFGTTYEGGPNGDGNVFNLTP